MTKFLLFLLCLPIVVAAQYDSNEVNLPMQNGIVCFEKKVSNVKHVSREILFDRANAWISKVYASSSDPSGVVADRKSGQISGNALYKIVVSESGNYYWIRPTVRIDVSDDGCVLRIYDFYEKPIEKGISNEYSKIEYRWRDFRKGKPWSKEDKPLFTGILNNVSSCMTSFEQSIVM